MKFILRRITILILFVLSHACATYKAQYADENFVNQNLPDKPVDHVFYLVGDAGKSPMDGYSDALLAFKTYLESHDVSKDDYAIYLGDNIYPAGLPTKDHKNRDDAENALRAQIGAVKNFKGKTIFIPGNHDWYADGLKGVKRQEKFIEDALGKNTFQPENGCPLESIDVSETVQLIIIDTQWYLEDWNDNPGINDDCEIKTRERFFLEVEGELKKAQNKTIVFAMHHPMYTNGVHGGQFAASKHIFPGQKKIPLPGLATLVAQIRTQGGVSIQDRYNERYNELMKRLETLAVDSKKLVFVSGHEHTLQYIEEGRIKQIVSGSGAKESYATLAHNGLFSYGKQGFAKLVIYKDGSAWVEFFSAENGKPKVIYQKEIMPPNRPDYDITTLPDSFPNKVEVSIYSKAETDKTGFFKSIWGENYRDVYSTKITAKVATLDTLYGGLEIVRKGGGHQTRSLRLKLKDGRELNMRALRKSATQYIQTVVFKDNFVENEFDETIVEDLILDFYTAAHPYAFLAVPKLSDAAQVLHTNPKLYYIPKHKHLGKYNDEYGNELYMIEERPEDHYADESNFGYADDIESTHDIIEKIRKDEEYKIDEEAFVRARLFDMLIGDWDRHQDQWRWAQFDQPNGDKLYRPIPRDRDQVFSNFDGTLLDIGRTISNATNQLQVYDTELKDIRWMNNAGHKLDKALIKQSDKGTWLAQAKFLQVQITDDIIETAFSDLPEAIQDETIEDIKAKLKGRRDNLLDIASRYSDYLDELVILTATDKDDFITITRLADKETRVQIWRNKGGEKANVIVDRTYHRDTTKEIWVYGLDDTDIFEVNGKGNNLIYTRLIGGQGNDTYIINNGRRIKVYDHKSKKNTVELNKGGQLKFTDDYKSNLYDFQKFISHTSILTPNIGFNPDDGFKVGLSLTKTTKGFERNPFSQQHKFRLGYYFATEGFDLRYQGQFANVFSDWNLKMGGVFTSANFTNNFFGIGNETENDDDELGLDYNRVKTSIVGVDVGIVKNSGYGSEYGFKAIFEGVELDNTSNRFISDFTPSTDEEFFERRLFTALEAEYNYHSADDEIATSRGMDFNIILGSKTEIEEFNSIFGYLNAHLGFYNALTVNRKLVLKTDVRTQLRFGDDFLFFQGANIGDGTGLRGYRRERFTGKNAFVTNADIRYSFNTFKTGWFPMQIGVFSGVDVGRVWVKNDTSEKWHNSYGGGFWVAAAESVAGTFNFFTGEDGLRFSFGFGLNF
ncbi:metallophosphoesterase [Winogradskyella aquimaris]|uniref:Metallophosphoesterase n=1 Tax=Winogradskyella aquimaris TaxID=864074 RepID=A0ABU5EPA1_9FLAO|nr:metallophosphoesterase [Winogradskyella aquimaris]MDY2587345.1 metallophosphoesterase [Winogradskyella aquimaris]